MLTLLLALALVTYTTRAATATLNTPIRTAPSRVSHSASTELLYSPPVNGDARAADEPPSPSAIPAPHKTIASPHLRTIRMEVTAYCPCPICCGPHARGITASGQPVSFNRGHFVAADTDLLPFGTRLLIPGYNHSRPVPVADRGGAIQGRRLDLFFPTHSQAQQFGHRWITVTIVE